LYLSLQVPEYNLLVIPETDQTGQLVHPEQAAYYSLVLAQSHYLLGADLDRDYAVVCTG
jgi:hypothetical protein